MTLHAPARAPLRLAVARAIAVAARARLSVMALPASLPLALLMHRLLTRFARPRRARPLTLPRPAPALCEHGLRYRIRIRLEA